MPTIMGEVQRHFCDKAPTIRVPRRLRVLRAEIYDASSRLGQQLGRSPRPSEVAEYLDTDVETVIEGLQAYQAAHVDSLDEPKGDDAGPTGDARFGAALGRTDAELGLVEFRESVGPLLDALPDRERRIVLLRFFGGLTQQQIAQRVGLSQMQVSRLLARTLATMRTQLLADQAPAT